MTYVVQPPAIPTVSVQGTEEVFPIHRIYCVGRNFAAHAIEMGHDPDKEPPFFFQKNPDTIIPSGGVFPYPGRSQDVHFEIEMVVALRRGGTDIPVARALEHVFGYAVGIDMTRRDLQEEAKQMDASPLSTIYNMLLVAEDLGTAGQPTTAQLAAIKDAGYDVVINLATGATPRDLPNEADVVATLGMDYIHIPVVWAQPTEADVDRFFEAMDATQHQKRFVHCIANMRVSAFVFLYRVLRQGVPLDEARATMARIWEPNPIWHQFIHDALARGQRNQQDSSAGNTI